jgi:hypothetical protein
MNLKTLLDITRKDELNFVSPFGLGDTMLLCGAKTALEERYKLPVHFIIKPSHKIVMKMYNNTNYSIYQFTEDELWGISKNNYSPQKGFLYVAHWIYSDDTCGSIMQRWNRGEFIFLQLFFHFFHLDKSTIIQQPTMYPQISEEMIASLGFGLVELQKTVLLLPEANSVTPLSKSFWINLADKIQKNGFLVVQNFTREDYKIEGVVSLPDNLELIMGVAVSCAEVYSLRSGLCDLIARKVKKLTVFHSDPLSYRALFMNGKNIENILVEKEEVYNINFRKTKKYILKQNVKIFLKKIPPVKQIVNRFRKIDNQLNDIFMRLGNMNRLYAESYNDILELFYAKEK